MKTIKLILQAICIIIAYLTLAFASIPAFAQKTCPDWGDATNPKMKALNALKNRSTTVGIPNKMDNITLEQMITTRIDTTDGINKKYGKTEGYLFKWKLGGSESCDCKTTNKDSMDRHLVIAMTADEKDMGNMVICEMTRKTDPKYKDKDFLNSLVGHKVRIIGYRFNDIEHLNASTNAMKKGGKLKGWRRTSLEGAHPIVSIELIE